MLEFQSVIAVNHTSNVLKLLTAATNKLNNELQCSILRHSNECLRVIHIRVPGEPGNEATSILRHSNECLHTIYIRVPGEPGNKATSILRHSNEHLYCIITTCSLGQMTHTNLFYLVKDPSSPFLSR